jgi:hypothetical protein
MTWGVARGPVRPKQKRLTRRTEGELFPVSYEAIHRNPLGLESLCGGSMSPNRKVPALLEPRCPGDVIGMVMSEKDGLNPAPKLSFRGFEGGFESCELIRILAARIDEEAVSMPDQVGVGMGGRGKRSGSEGKKQDAGAKFDPPQRTQVALRRIQQSRNAFFWAVFSQNPENVVNRRCRKLLSPVQSVQCDSWLDPLPTEVLGS